MDVVLLVETVVSRHVPLIVVVKLQQTHVEVVLALVMAVVVGDVEVLVKEAVIRTAMVV